MSKGLYLCWLKPGHQSCADHNRKIMVDRLMAPLEAWAEAQGIKLL